LFCFTSVFPPPPQVSNGEILFSSPFSPPPGLQGRSCPPLCVNLVGSGCFLFRGPLRGFCSLLFSTVVVPFSHFFFFSPFLCDHSCVGPFCLSFPAFDERRPLRGFFGLFCLLASLWRFTHLRHCSGSLDSESRWDRFLRTPLGRDSSVVLALIRLPRAAGLWVVGFFFPFSTQLRGSPHTTRS